MATTREKIEWEEEGDTLFNYMINNFDDLFEYKNDKKQIKYFDLHKGYWASTDEIDELEETCFNDIHTQLVSWIQNEFESKELFEYLNWRPFRDQESFNYMILGYRKFFIYKQYYFQLSLMTYYYSNNDDDKRFVAALCGWKEENKPFLQPFNCYKITSDNKIQDNIWNDINFE